MVVLATYRKNKRLSQFELAERIGVSQQAVAKWETGICFPRADLLPKLAQVLGCSIDDLLRKDEANGA